MSASSSSNPQPAKRPRLDPPPPPSPPASSDTRPDRKKLFAPPALPGEKPPPPPLPPRVELLPLTPQELAEAERVRPDFSHLVTHFYYNSTTHLAAGQGVEASEEEQLEIVAQSLLEVDAEDLEEESEEQEEQESVEQGQGRLSYKLEREERKRKKARQGFIDEFPVESDQKAMQRFKSQNHQLFLSAIQNQLYLSAIRAEFLYHIGKTTAGGIKRLLLNTTIPALMHHVFLSFAAAGEDRLDFLLERAIATAAGQRSSTPPPFQPVDCKPREVLDAGIYLKRRRQGTTSGGSILLDGEELQKRSLPLPPPLATSGTFRNETIRIPLDLVPSLPTLITELYDEYVGSTIALLGLFDRLKQHCRPKPPLKVTTTNSFAPGVAGAPQPTSPPSSDSSFLSLSVEQRTDFFRLARLEQGQNSRAYTLLVEELAFGFNGTTDTAEVLELVAWTRGVSSDKLWYLPLSNPLVSTHRTNTAFPIMGHGDGKVAKFVASLQTGARYDDREASLSARFWLPQTPTEVELEGVRTQKRMIRLSLSAFCKATGTVPPSLEQVQAARFRRSLPIGSLILKVNPVDASPSLSLLDGTTLDNNILCGDSALRLKAYGLAASIDVATMRLPEAWTKKIVGKWSQEEVVALMSRLEEVAAEPSSGQSADSDRFKTARYGTEAWRTVEFRYITSSVKNITFHGGQGGSAISLTVKKEALPVNVNSDSRLTIKLIAPSLPSITTMPTDWQASFAVSPSRVRPTRPNAPSSTPTSAWTSSTIPTSSNAPLAADLDNPPEWVPLGPVNEIMAQAGKWVTRGKDLLVSVTEAKKKEEEQERRKAV